MFSRFLLLVCLSFGFFGSAFSSAGRIAGTVLDSDGSPLPGASVRLLPGDRIAVTGEDGRFAFEAVSEGTCQIEVEHPGYRRLRSESLSVRSGDELDVSLRFSEISAPRSIQVDVIGLSNEGLRQIPGATHVITPRDIESSRALDLNEVLRRAPGVYVREDSGPVAMRLNLGIRGLDPTRSRQILVLEDGLPMALAPYGEPEMYYTPPIDRLERVEILKGSGSILYGPQTVGGVINFVTPDPPLHPEGRLELAAGSHGLFIGHADYGATFGDTGVYVGYLRKQGDGFRDFFYNINDLTGRVLVNMGRSQRLSLRLNVYDEDSNSTYLGLTQPLFDENPDQNPVPHDRLWVNRFSGSAAHQIYLGGESVLTTTFYAYTTTRNWQRQDFDRTDRGVPYVGVVGDVTRPGGAIFLRNSTGNRNRSFHVVGVEPRLQTAHRLFGARQKLELGFRQHFERAFEKRLDGERFDSRTGNLREDEIRTGHAQAGFVQNRIFLSENAVLSPGLRVERFHYDRHILRQPVAGVPTDVDIREESEVFEWIPGLGFSYDLGGRVTLFSGVHRGFAPPRIKDAITREGEAVRLDAESSWNFELGSRFQPSGWSYGELTFFNLDFSNQIIPASEAGGATATLTNAGRTLHRGVEGALGIDFGRLLDARSSLLSEVRFTRLPVAHFASGIYDGNRLPYAPENLWTLLFRYADPGGLEVQLDGTYVGEHFTDRANTMEGSPDGTVGILPSYGLWNLTFGYRLPQRSVTPYVAVKNLFDERYIASRAPQGIQPGWPRMFTFGFRMGF